VSANTSSVYTDLCQDGDHWTIYHIWLTLPFPPHSDAHRYSEPSGKGSNAFMLPFT